MDDTDEDSFGEMIIEPENQHKQNKNRHGVAAALIGTVFVLLCVALLVHFIPRKEDQKTLRANKIGTCKLDGKAGG